MPSLVLSMIVQNAVKLLPARLHSVRAIADQIVIADTGSADNTVELARAMGARGEHPRAAAAVAAHY